MQIRGGSPAAQQKVAGVQRNYGRRRRINEALFVAPERRQGYEIAPLERSGESACLICAMDDRHAEVAECGIFGAHSGRNISRQDAAPMSRTMNITCIGMV